MKKAFFLAVILIMTVFTTGCINNLAIEELNNKAAEYMEKGDYPNAICRLEASIDLDDKVFQTQYNLAVAYTENEDYDKAIETFNKALELNNKSVDTYYSLAVAYENYAKSLYKGETKQQKENEENTNEESEDGVKLQFNEDGTYKPTENEIQLVKQYYTSAIENYTKYSQMNISGNSFENIEEKVNELQGILNTLNSGNDTN